MTLTPPTEAAKGRGLPALRGLGTLADSLPVLVIDSREQAPLEFEHLPTVPGTLYSGDYSIRALEHLFAIERKSLEDIVACCMGENRARFERELGRMRGLHFKQLVIVGIRAELAAGQYRSRITPKAVLATLNAFEVRYDTPIIFAETPRVAAELIERWAWWFAREVVQNANNLLRGCQGASVGARRASIPQDPQKLAPQIG